MGLLTAPLIAFTGLIVIAEDTLLVYEPVFEGMLRPLQRQVRDVRSNEWLCGVEIETLHTRQLDRLPGHPKVIGVLHCKPAFRRSAHSF